MPKDWYGSDESKAVAENVLLYQRSTGGWPRSPQMHLPLTDETRSKLLREKNMPGGTFDNKITTSQMKFLAKMYNATGDGRYKDAFVHGVEYMFAAQYENGGWPQFYPLRSDYSRHITYNDNTMYLVMDMMKQFANRNPEFYFAITDDVVARAKTAFDKGVQCYLNTQVVINGKPTIWCQQHDEVTLKPAGARTYELPSLCGHESVPIVIQLMEIPDPSPEIIRAVQHAIEWFENHKVEGLRYEDFINSDGLEDRRTIEDPNAPTTWGRFYDLETQEVFVCDLDGVKRKSVNDLGYDRRRYYRWYMPTPQKALNLYPEWKKKHIDKINQ